jgi:hypothetical protein
VFKEADREAILNRGVKVEHPKHWCLLTLLLNRPRRPRPALRADKAPGRIQNVA